MGDKNEHVIRYGDLCAEQYARLVAAEKYEAAIRRIRDQRGDDRCWRDFEELFRLLPEGYTPPARDTTVELEYCRKFIDSLRNPATVYVSPQREIEELRRLIVHMKAHNMRGFACDGFDEMTSEQQTLYNQVWFEATKEEFPTVRKPR